MEIRYLTFSDLGLDPGDSDELIWHRCQEREVYLLTSNRHADGPDSLETTIREHNTSQSLPVFAIGDADRLLDEPTYCERVIERLLEYLLEPDNFRGTGRLYLP